MGGAAGSSTNPGGGPDGTGATTCSASPTGATANVWVPPEPFTLVNRGADLSMVMTAVEESSAVGVDCETTGLDARRNRVRLLSLATERGLYVLDLFAVAAGALFEVLAEKRLIFHNGLFDLQMLAPLGFVPGAVTDTMLLSQLVNGTRRPKGFHGLEETVRRELGQQLDKHLQGSSWTGVLSEAQLAYAAADAAVLLPLHAALAEKVRTSGQQRVAEIEARCLPALAWLARCGMPFDRESWNALGVEAAEGVKRLAGRMDELAPQRPAHLLREGGWNWDSPDQVREAFSVLGITLDATDDDALAAVGHPLADLVRDYRSATKLASTYGPKWTKDAYSEGRLFAAWRQVGCVTGRMACSSPNLQNLPAEPHYRRCFRPPAGRVLIKADYSQIELRLAAKIAGDRAMMDAYARGDDLHTLTARRMLGRDDVTPRDRKVAKPVNFGLIYGLQVRSLRAKAKADYGLDLSAEDAERYRRAFFTAYPGIGHWHRQIRRARATETRTLAGRRVLVEAGGFFGGKANYAVQGSGGDGLKTALALLWERRGQAPRSFPVAVVHDEIVVEADAEGADAAAAWVKKAMVDGMAPLLDPVPVEVDMQVGPSWAGD
jgi:DNA polymerase-1